MYLGEFVTALGNRVKDFDVALDANKAIAKLYINQAYKWVYRAHRWETRRKFGQLVIQPYFTTGTCSYTTFNGTNESTARIVNIAGATLTADMRGRFFQVQGSNDWHKITYVDTTLNRINLETPILDTSGSSFNIWKRFYYLPGEVALLTDMGRWDKSYGRMEFKDYSALVDEMPNVSDVGFPNDFTPFGVDNYEPSYSTGTIQGIADSNLITGSGTTFLGNVLPGDRLSVNTKTFFVKRVEDNSRIILNNYIPDTISAGATYEISRNVSLGFQFYPNLNSYLTIPYVYLDRAFDMVHETKDRPNLPDDLFDDVILSRAEFKLLKDKDSSKWQTVAQLFSAELEAVKSKVRVVQTRKDVFGPSMIGYPGRSGGSY